MDEWSRRPIGPAAYARGVSACLENGRALIDDALTLLEAGRSARAVALAILALEEGDKIKRLVRLMLLKDPADIEREWLAFRDHKPKLTSALSLLTHGNISLLADRLPPPKKPLAQEIKWIAELPRLAERLKVRCLYVALLRDGKWTAPTRMAPRLMAQAVIASSILIFSVTTTLVLGIDLLIGGQLAESEGLKRPELSEGTPRAKRWLRWRLGRAGQRWGQRELTRLMAWLDSAEERSQRLSNRARAAGWRKESRTSRRRS